MKKVIETVFSGYLNDQFQEFMPPYGTSKSEDDFHKLWNNMTKNLPAEESKKYSDLRNDCEYEITRREFINAFRLGFMLGAEVFSNE
ncbi:MAG: hypothetical protein E7508_04985 [Ruminococcus sp.]|nr:hypothetical protein [Ruminococcus sp.]